MMAWPEVSPLPLKEARTISCKVLITTSNGIGSARHKIQGT